MKNLNRYTVTALWLTDFLSDDIRRIIHTIGKCTSLTETEAELERFCSAAATVSRHILRTNPAAMTKIGNDARMFGFSESELSRRLRITNGEHTDKLTVITWAYDEILLYMFSSIDPAEKKLQSALTAELYDKARAALRLLVSSLISRGCYAEINGKNHRYQFFAASSGQMRKQRFILLRDDMYKKHNEAMTLGLSEGKGGAGITINASKWLPYKALCMSSGLKQDWFDIDKCIVVPDHTVQLTATVDTVTTDYDIVRAERSDIENPINDGIGFYWHHGQKLRNLQIRYAFVKGLLTPLNFVSLFRLYGKEPVVTDLWGNKVNLVEQGIEVILTESQMKLNKAYFSSWNEYKALCKKYQREFVLLNEDGAYRHNADLSYQMCQDLYTATDDELEGLASMSIETMRDMLTPEGALAALKADRTTIHSDGFQKALHLLPELLGDAYTKQRISMLYDHHYRTACSGKLMSSGKYHYIVPDPIALFEACLLQISPKGIIRAGEVWQRDLTPGHKVDVLRSPHMYTTEHCVREVARYRKAFDFMDTDAVYLSIWGLDARQLMCDYDGDIALVVDDPNLVNTAEHCIADTDSGVLYYQAQKAPKKPLNNDAVTEAIFNASDFNKIGIYSIYAVKLLASDNPDWKVLAMLAAAGNYAIDAVKTGAAIALPKGVEKMLRKLDKPHWWRYDHQTGEHPYSDSEYWDAELTQQGNGSIDRIGRIIRNAVPAKASVDVQADPSLWTKLVADPRRKTVIGAVDVFKECARRNALEWKKIFSKRPELLENWSEAEVISDRKIKTALDEIVAAAGGDLLAAYDTIARALFKYPNETAFKHFFWTVFGDIAYEVIKANLEKDGSLAA